MRHPLSASQMGIWVAQQLWPDTCAMFNNPAALRIRGPLDVPELETAIERLVDRHDMLRVAFTQGPGGPEQVEDRHRPHLQVEPWRGAEAQLRAELDRRARQPFALEEAVPVARFSLLELGACDRVLLVNLHHIVADGWSKAVLLDELLRLLKDSGQGPDSEQPLPGRFFDHIAAQQDYRQTLGYERDLTYWTTLLKPPLPSFELPCDRRRSASPQRRGGLIEFGLDAALAVALKARAQQLKSSLFSVLLAAFFVLLHRNTGQRDLIVGVPFASRMSSEFERTVGPFVNALPIRLQVDAECRFSELVAQVKRALLEAFRHQRVPFEEIVRVVKPQRRGGSFPIYQVMFQLDNLPMPALTGGDLELSPIALDTALAQMDLSIAVQQEAESLVGQVGFDAEILDRASASRFVEQLEVILAAAASDPQVAVGRMPVLSAAEQDALRRWNDTVVPLPAVPGVYGLITRQIRTGPGEIAVEHRGRSVSYGELGRAAAALAGWLQRAGAAAGDRVAILEEVSPLQIAAQLAVWSLGASYVPLDPGSPQRRNLAMLADASPRLVLCSRALYQALAGEGLSVLEAPDWSSLIRSGEPAELAWGAAAETGDAVVVYTSGTMGRPKGVRLTHRNLLNLALSFIQSYAVSPTDAVLPVTAPTAATFLGESFPTLAAGARLVLADSTISLDLEALRELIRSHRITILSTVPSLAPGLDAMADSLGSLRLVLFGGEALQPRHVRALRSAVQVVNSYGLTEGGVCSTYHVLSAEEDRSRPMVPIGRPIMNTRVNVLSDSGMAQPMGVSGELCLAGEGLAAGYLDESLNEGRFVEGCADRPRLLHTGDLARWLPTGELELLGRKDRQLQIRGQRVEPAEIECCLQEIPGISQAYVALRRDGKGESLPVAFVVSDEGAALPVELLRARLSTDLPPHMVPTAFMCVDAMPVDTTGRIDESRLPSVPADRFGAAEEIVPPETATERALALIWCELLGRSQVSVESNFFDVGGHSLLLTQLQARIRSRFDRGFPLVELFRLTSIRSLARHLDSASAGAPEPGGGSDEPRRVERRRAALVHGGWPRSRP